MAEGLLGRKIGMTSVFREGESIPVTVVEAGPCTVVQVKTTEGRDGYDALQLGYLSKKEKHVNRPMAGHYSHAGVQPAGVLREFRGMTGRNVGDKIQVQDLFEEGDIVDVRGRTKGRGFTGVMKRHNFSGAKASHGVHESYRGPGSIGACAWPARVWKGKRMAGQYGNTMITMQNLEVIEVIAEKNLVLLKGAVPGARNSVIELHKKEF